MVRSSRIQLRQISGVLFLSLLVSPFLVLLAKIPGGMDLSQSRGLLWALQNSVLQALGSALLAVVAGGAIALGLLSQAPNAFARVACEKLLIAPALLPTLFSLVLCLSIIDPFPFGILGIAIVHAFINMGLVGVSLAREMERDLAGMSQVAWLEGASRGLLLKALRQPLFHKLRTAFFFVFTICFSSFTVPLMVGGGRGTTLEVLIYEKIRIEGNLNTALGFSLLQSALVLLFSFWFLRQSSTPF